MLIMEININGMTIEIQKTYYNKSKVQEDGVTHIIDTEHRYPVFQFGMAKNYFDIDDKNELIKLISKDLKDISSELEKQIDKEKDNKEVER